MVKEYETEVLASDSEDEKYIHKAEKSALQKHRQNVVKQERAGKTASHWHSTSSDGSRNSNRKFF